MPLKLQGKKKAAPEEGQPRKKEGRKLIA